jgi:uncharacterized protein
MNGMVTVGLVKFPAGTYAATCNQDGIVFVIKALFSRHPMATLRFSEFVSDRLAYYVYRLIDPRDGTTFYVGRGQGNRVFDHAAGKQFTVDPEDVESVKLKTIGDIKNAGMEVQHVIHRHGMTEDGAKEVEAALIDAYPGLSNIQPGYDDQRGVMHAVEVIAEYEAPLAAPKHRLLIINVSRSLADHHNLIDAVRFAWKIDPKKASAADYPPYRGRLTLG